MSGRRQVLPEREVRRRLGVIRRRLNECEYDDIIQAVKDGRRGPEQSSTRAEEQRR